MGTEDIQNLLNASVGEVSIGVRIKTSESVIGSGDVLNLKNSNSGHISPPYN